MKNIQRRKKLVLLLILVLGIMLLASCGKNTSEISTPVVPQEAEPETSAQTDTQQDETTMETPPATEPILSENADTELETSDILVVYFSATGHTAPLAEYAAEYLNADLYEIVPEVPYTEEDLNYNDSSTRATMEQHDAEVRPAIAGTLPDISSYNTILIGHPIWWGQAPKIIYTFLESYDWTGKTLATFCTSGSSGLGSSVDNLKMSASGNPNWLESRRFSIDTGRDDVIEWLTACQINR